MSGSDVNHLTSFIGMVIVNANVCAVASGGNINGGNTSGENITGAIILIKAKFLATCLPTRQIVRL